MYSSLIADCILVAVIDTTESVDFVMNEFAIKSKIGHWLDYLEWSVKDKKELDPIETANAIEYANTLFKNTPFNFVDIKDTPLKHDMPLKLLKQVKNMLYGMFYLVIDPKSSTEVTDRAAKGENYKALLKELRKNVHFQPITKQSTWDGSKKAISIIIGSHIDTKKVTFSRNTLANKVEESLYHELTHNEQYLRRQHLSFDQQTTLPFKTIDNDPDMYHNRYDEISAFANGTIKAYEAKDKSDFYGTIMLMKQRAIDNPKVFKKFVRDCFNILHSQKRDFAYIKKFGSYFLKPIPKLEFLVMNELKKYM